MVPISTACSLTSQLQTNDHFPAQSLSIRSQLKMWMTLLITLRLSLSLECQSQVAVQSLTIRLIAPEAILLQHLASLHPLLYSMESRTQRRSTAILIQTLDRLILTSSRIKTGRTAIHQSKQKSNLLNRRRYKLWSKMQPLKRRKATTAVTM